MKVPGFLPIILLGFCACACTSRERLKTLSDKVLVDTAWTEVPFRLHAEAEFRMNELRLSTASAFLPGEGQDILHPGTRVPIGLQVVLVSMGGQDYPLDMWAVGKSKEGTQILATSDALQSEHVGNRWVKMRIRSRIPVELESVQWHSWDPRAVNYP